MDLSDTRREQIISVLGVLIIVQAVSGAYFLATGDTTQATIAFSSVAVLSGSMAAISTTMDDA